MLQHIDLGTGGVRTRVRRPNVEGGGVDGPDDGIDEAWVSDIDEAEAV